MMQKKVEKLPGLSNVSGKYTKKCPSDNFPHTSLLSKPNASVSCGTSVSPTCAQEDVNASLPTSKVTHCQPSNRYTPNLNPPSQLKPSLSRPQLRRGSYLLNSSVHQSATVSSPSWPSSLSAANTESKMLATTAPMKSVVNTRRASKATEMVKSSSSGSVVGLGQKPTGIILATPSNPSIKPKPLSRFQYSNRNTTTTGDSSTVKTQGPSTPYPRRQAHFPPIGRVPSMGTREGSMPVERRVNFEEAGATSRPSVLVRPINKVNYSSSEVSPDVRGFGVNLSDSCDSFTREDSNSRSNLGHQLYTRSSSWQASCDQIHAVELVTRRRELCGLSASNTPGIVASAGDESKLEASYAGPSHTQADSDSVMYEPRSVLHSLPFPQPTSIRSHATMQPRYVSMESVRPVLPPFWKPPALPGLQHTRCALEQYLSDLIAGEQQQRFVPSSSSSSLSPSLSVDGTRCLSAADADPKDSLESLRFLHSRIENALQGVRSESAIGSSDHATLNSLDVEANPSNSGSILEQFSEQELYYLLNAVHELISLRSQLFPVTSLTSETTSGAGLAVSKSTHSWRTGDSHLRKPKLTESSTASRTSSRSNSSVRTARRSLEHSPVAVDEHRLPNTASTSTPLGEHDTSATDLMHKRLPLGFQHFERYLDSKFGPDSHARRHHSRQRPSIQTHGSSDEGGPLDGSVRSGPPHTLADDQSDHSSLRPFIAGSQTHSVQNLRFPSSVTMHNSEFLDPTGSAGRCLPGSRSFDGEEHPSTSTQLVYSDSDSRVLPYSSGSHFSYDAALSHETANSFTPPVDFSSRAVPVPHSTQTRSYCSTPEVPDVHGAALSRWSFAPHLQHHWCGPNLEHAAHPYLNHVTPASHLRGMPILPQQSAAYTAYPTQELCSCGSEHQPACCPTFWLAHEIACR